MKPTIVSVTLLVLVGAVNPVERPQEPPVVLEPVVQHKVPKQVEKPAEKPVEPVVDPQGCEPEQYWAEEPPHNCIDKPREPVATVARSVANPVGCEHYRHLVEQYPWNVDTMMYAMQKESGCNPNAVGDNYVIGGIYAPSCGLLQVRTLAGRPSCEALKDPATNIATAFAIWQGQGYRAWTVLH